ncbi:MAG: helix-turn-helix transcriptional regulator [Patescibacteria group bacterium]
MKKSNKTPLQEIDYAEKYYKLIIKGHKFYTFDEVFEKSMKSKAFRDAYNTELAEMRIKKQIREARLKKKMSQKTLAKRASMTQSMIARVENTRHGFSYSTIYKIATALGKQIQLV